MNKVLAAEPLHSTRPRSAAVLLVLLVFFTLVGASLPLPQVLGAFFLHRTLPPHERILQLEKEFFNTAAFVAELDAEPGSKLPMPAELLRPDTVLPHTALVDLAASRTLYEFAQTCELKPPVLKLPENLQKAVRWHQLLCGGKDTLGESFFETPPFVHPSGQSFSALALNLDKGPERSGNASRVVKDAFLERRLHLEELRGNAAFLAQLPPAQLQFLSWFFTFTQDEIYQFLGGTRLLVNRDYFLLQGTAESSGEKRSTRVFTRSAAEAFFGTRHWKASAFEPQSTSAWQQESLCWNFNSQLGLREWIALFASGTLAMVCVGAVALYLARLLERRKNRAEQTLILQTLTHELRTPVTSLSLASDVLRNDFERLEPPAQRALLTVFTDVTRLQRVIRASRSYLSAEAQGRTSKNDAASIGSINEMLREILEPFAGEIKIQLCADSTLNTDPHWFALCVCNLVQNALTHGQKPVVVSSSRTAKMFVVTVADAGVMESRTVTKLFRPFVKGEKSTGMGLGLVLVQQKARDLGGSLKVTTRPQTVFYFSVRDLK